MDKTTTSTGAAIRLITLELLYLDRNGLSLGVSFSIAFDIGYSIV